MVFLRELLPFFLGMIIIPPLFMLIIPQKWSERFRFITVFAISVVIGLIGSTMVGEQVGELNERIIALVIDSSTAYAGSQIAYWLFWKAALGTRLQPNSDLVK